MLIGGRIPSRCRAWCAAVTANTWLIHRLSQGGVVGGAAENRILIAAPLRGAVTRFCPACKRFRARTLLEKQARCKSCSVAAKQARRADSPGRDAELKARGVPGEVTPGTAEKALFHISPGIGARR